MGNLGHPREEQQGRRHGDVKGHELSGEVVVISYNLNIEVEE